MKKILFSVALLGASFLLNAQSLKDINFMLLQGKIDAAKVAIDKAMLDSKLSADPEASFLKGSIYNEVSKNKKLLPLEAYNFKATSFDAFKKYLATDKKAQSMVDQGNFPLLELYANLVDLGTTQFNNKSFNDAFNSFVKSQEVEDFIFEKGYTYKELKLNKLDTNLVLNTAAAAINKADSATAVKYYTKLIDAGVKDNEAVYDIVVRYYMDNKDEKNFKANLAKAQKMYPTNTYWNNLELDYLSKYDRTAMLAKYEEFYIKEPGNINGTMNYGIELYNYYYDNVKGKKDSAISVKMIEVLKRASKNGDETNNSNTLLANHLYNLAAVLSEKSDAIKSLKPADVKLKKDLVSASNAMLNELIPYAENSIKFFKALPTLKSGQKSNYRLAAGYLSEAYKATKNLPKAAEYEKLMNSLNAK